MRGSSKRWILCAALVMILGVAIVVPAVAQDEAHAGPMPFIFTVRGEVDPSMMTEYSEAIGAIAEAHGKHDNGNNWVAYMPLTSDGTPRFHIFIPLQKAGEIDGWTPMWQVMSEVHGPEKAAEVLTTISKCWTPETLLLNYNSSVSNPADPPLMAPPPFAYHMTVRVQPGANFEYVGMAQKFAEAHGSHDDGMHWVGYNNMIGGSGPEIHYFIALDKLGDMDSWPMNAKVMVDALGQEEWTRMQKRLTEITEVSSEILIMSPPHSNLETHGDGGDG